MKSVTSLGQFTPADVKPEDLYRQYVELTQEDVSELFPEKSLSAVSSCPACQSKESQPAFDKLGMHYVECAGCRSLYINPRPDDATILNYYAKSRAEQFWHENLSRASSSFRKEKMIESRIRWVGDYASELDGSLHLVDIHTHQDGWLEALAQLELFSSKTLVAPLVEVPDDIAGQLSIVDQPASEMSLNAPADVVTLFEAVDRVSNPDQLFQSIARNLKSGGLCLVTAILASGFDIQTLWDRSENLFPPDRLNVLTVEGFEALFEKHGFDVVEFSTPGGFDTDFVLQAKKSDPGIELPRAISYWLEHRSVEVREAFQQFLQSGLLSSSGRMVLRKR